MSVMQLIVYLVVNPIMVNNFAALFNCTQAGRASDFMKNLAYKLSIKLVGARSSVICRPHRGSSVWLVLLQRFSVGFALEYSSYFTSVLNLDLYVCCLIHWWVRSPLRGPSNLYVYEPQQSLGRGLCTRKPHLVNFSVLKLPQICT